MTKSASDVAPATITDESDTESKVLKVPGELVLAYGLRKYYPARVLSQPAPNRYLVEFFDGSRSTLSRSRVLTMYESKFYTCALGAIRLVGDDPIQNTKQRIDSSCKKPINPEAEFERDKIVFRKLVASMQEIKVHLDTLHQCPLNQLQLMMQVEDRMAIFFGNDINAKRRLPSRVSKGHLNRAEFDFLSRLLSKWYDTPPLAALAPQISNDPSKLVETPTKESNKDGTVNTCILKNGKSSTKKDIASGITQLTEPVNRMGIADSNNCKPGLSAQSVEFVHEVLLPHAIKRLTMAQENCTLAESEILMVKANETHWVDQILAARGISRDKLQN
ncbi:hypothetical protein IWW36_000421 [Coemansia brasiliensis]|uniref:Uncharacterized protein n=1 Tax=Coemansia brasiliensis TaxID=2650707 RepID=A0A9W8IDJ0_9FUNG|nr:hypothetical protein IWW36_000421 [Coemansia brasiliensis]